MYSLFIECLPESVVDAAFLSVPFRGVCSVARCCGQSQLCCEMAAKVIPFAAAVYSVYTFVGHEQGKQLSEHSVSKERLKSLDRIRALQMVWLRTYI